MLTPIDFSTLNGPEIHGMPVTSEAMAKQVLEAGYEMICQCGPLQVCAGRIPDAEYTGYDYTLNIFNTDGDNEHSTYKDDNLAAAIVSQAQTFGLYSSGAWTIHYPEEPDV
jgi:hypothetical protein